MEKKKKFSFPNTALLLMIVIAFMTLLTYIVPPGEFDRVFDENTGRTIIVADSFRYIEHTPASPWTALGSMYTGLMEVSDIIAVMLVCGGVIGIIIESGAIQAGLGGLIKRVGHKESLLFCVMMTAFAVPAATVNMAEEFIAFIPLMVAIALSLGYDKITGISIVLLGAYAGIGASITGPFNILIAQKVAELPLLSGMGLRTVCFAGALVIAIQHTVCYAKRVKNNPQLGCFGEGDLDTAEQINLEDYEFTAQRKIILFLLFASITVLVIGLAKFGWDMKDMCAVFMLNGLISGAIYFSGDMNRVTSQFLKSAETMAVACVLVALSRGILVVLTDGCIIDTIIHAISIPLSSLNGVLAAWGIFLSQLIINLFVPSSSAQAMVVMPILTPLADMVGISRQVVCQAYMCGDGFGNMIIPTHPTLLACLGIAGVSFGKWFKYAVPLVLKWCVWTCAILAVGVLIKWGPF